ncbi:MAG TPA: hypothetical protein VFV57_06045 [Limnobacter sp.]|nr:hypothetical protein [Limnobacter sp.]
MTTLAELKNPTAAPVVKFDLFTLQGFELAQRVAKSLASSDAVPAAFRSHVLKKGANGTETWVENPSALGNCLVAMEVAQSVGMSVIAVMQNADVIEGRLRWSGKFKIAAINASRRFSPLSFEFVPKGRITAKYQEKGAWNDARRRYDMIERSVEIDDIECYAWAFALDAHGRPTDRVVKGPKVSILMAVQEGWYGKAGSKWQGALAELMLTYRAGSFFADVHAPDVVMGMGRTAEEERDIMDLVEQPDGTFAPAGKTEPATVNAAAAKAKAAAPRATVAPSPEQNIERVRAQNIEELKDSIKPEALATGNENVPYQATLEEGPKNNAPFSQEEIARIRAQEIAQAQEQERPAATTVRPRRNINLGE